MTTTFAGKYWSTNFNRYRLKFVDLTYELKMGVCEEFEAQCPEQALN